MKDRTRSSSRRDWQVYRQALMGCFHQAQSALDDPQSGDVCHRNRQHTDHCLWIQALTGHGEAKTAFVGGVALWLWLCVIFANFSEALAEGRGKAQAAALRKARQETQAKKLSRAEIRS